jgi:hypothetical protein
MDTVKLSQVFAELKSLLSTQGSGKHWDAGRRPKEPQQAVVGYGIEAGTDEATIVTVAEETRLHACGLSQQPRLTRKHRFVCSAQPVTEPHRLGASMILDGRQFYLNQLLRTSGMQWLVDQRCLLSIDERSEHTGRNVKVAWKLQDGIGYQLIHKDRRKYTIARHTATFIELDEAPQPYGTGYLVLEFL